MMMMLFQRNSKSTFLDDDDDYDDYDYDYDDGGGAWDKSK